MPEPPLTDRELRVVRGMIEEYQERLAVDRWFRIRWFKILKGIAAASAVVITVAAIEEIIRSALGG